LSQIERVCDSIRDLQMMVVDPISAYLPGIDTNSQTEVRRAMENLTLFAARRRIAVVLIAHNRKAAAATAKHRVLGSLAFTAAARSVFGAARDPGSDRKRLLLPIKTNLTATRRRSATRST